MILVSANFPFLAAVLLLGIAFYIMIFKRYLIKIVMGVTILGSAVNLFLITLGYREGGIAPIYTAAPEGTMVLPVVQALTLTNIVIGVAVMALMLTIIMYIYRHKKDIDSGNNRLLKG